MTTTSIQRAGLLTFAIMLLLSATACAKPVINITVIPIYDKAGGTGSSAYIEGTVSGVNPNDYWVVIYSLTDQWYIQPQIEHPYTGIRADKVWSANIHTGTRYAALLIRKDAVNGSKFSLSSPTGVRPGIGNPGIVAETEIEGKRTSAKAP